MATDYQFPFSRSGRHVPGIGLWLLLALIPLTAAYPQEELASGLEDCAALSADAERLACYDRLQSGAQQADDGSNDIPPPDASAAPAQTTTPAERMEPDAESVQTAEPAEEPPRRSFWRRLRDRIARRPAETTGTDVSPAEAGSSTAQTAEAAAIDESVADDGIEVTVVDVRRNLSGLAVFLTENNGTWVQISTRDRSYPGTPFTAHITGGLMGGRFLTPESGGIAVRVRGPE